MKTSDFYYDLPEELIAQDPLEGKRAAKFTQNVEKTTWHDATFCLYNNHE